MLDQVKNPTSPAALRKHDGTLALLWQIFEPILNLHSLHLHFAYCAAHNSLP
jgi:hypothetical protein